MPTEPLVPLAEEQLSRLALRWVELHARQSKSNAAWMATASSASCSGSR